MMGESFVDLESARIRFVERGAGEPVIFLHAGVGDRRMWVDAMADLAPRHRAIAYDRRGFGETEVDPSAPFAHVDDLRLVLDGLEVDEMTLVGCSQGGRIAIDFAIAAPDRVRRLILVAPALSGDRTTVEESPEERALDARIDAADEAGDLDLLNELEAFAWLDGLPDQGRVGGAARDLFLDMNGIALRHSELTAEREPPAASPRLASIDAPTRIAWGDRDFPSVRDRAARIASAIPGARTHVFSGCAHLPMLERRTEFAEWLQSSLDSA